MRLMRLSEIGGLPVGTLTASDDGERVRNRSVTFRKWTAKTALEIGQIRDGDSSSDLGFLQLQHETLCRLVKTWCGLDFDTLTEDQRSQALDVAYAGDVMAAWILLRISALGPVFPAKITCTRCHGKVSPDAPPTPFTFDFDLRTLECETAGWVLNRDGGFTELPLEVPEFGYVELEDGFEFSPRVQTANGPKTVMAKRVRLAAPRWKATRDLPRAVRSVTGLEPATVRMVVREIEGMDPTQLSTMSLADFAERLSYRDMLLISEAVSKLKFPGPALVIEEKCPNSTCGAAVHYRIDPRYGGDFFTVRGSSR